MTLPALEPRSGTPRLDIGFTAVAPGPQTVKVRLEFFACSSTWCVKQAREVGVEIAVAPASDRRGDSAHLGEGELRATSTDRK